MYLLPNRTLARPVVLCELLIHNRYCRRICFVGFEERTSFEHSNTGDVEIPVTHHVVEHEWWLLSGTQMKTFRDYLDSAPAHPHGDRRAKCGRYDPRRIPRFVEELPVKRIPLLLPIVHERGIETHQVEMIGSEAGALRQLITEALHHDACHKQQYERKRHLSHYNRVTSP